MNIRRFGISTADGFSVKWIDERAIVISLEFTFQLFKIGDRSTLKLFCVPSNQFCSPLLGDLLRLPVTGEMAR